MYIDDYIIIHKCLVLSALGVEDYGIYNVVGGFVAMFTMISASLSSAISRFINIIGAGTFGVLLIHANSETMRNWLWHDVFL